MLALPKQDAIGNPDREGGNDTGSSSGSPQGSAAHDCSSAVGKDQRARGPGATRRGARSHAEAIQRPQPHPQRVNQMLPIHKVLTFKFAGSVGTAHDVLGATNSLSLRIGLEASLAA